MVSTAHQGGFFGREISVLNMHTLGWSQCLKFFSEREKMKFIVTAVASLFAVTAFAQAPAAPAKKEEAKPAAAKAEPAKKDDKKAEPAKK